MRSSNYLKGLNFVLLGTLMKMCLFQKIEHAVCYSNQRDCTS